MTLSLFVLAAVCVVNAPRARSVLPTAHESVPAGAGDRLTLAGLGAGLTLVAVVAFAGFADPLLDLVDIAPATARIATGLLLVATGVLLLGWPMPQPQPALPGRRAALVPVAFPTLLSPGLALLAVTASVDRSAPVAVVVFALALATVPAVAAIPDRPRGSAGHRALDGLARALAGLLVLAGLGLLFDGVFDL